jgi:hypothetical protein
VLEELTELIEVGADGFYKDRDKVLHLLRRAWITVRQAIDDTQTHQGEIQRLQYQRQAQGRATTLSPMDAARFLSDAQKASLFDELQQARLRRLEAQLADAEQTAAAARHSHRQLEQTIRALLADPTLPQPAVASLRRALTELHAGTAAALDQEIRP